MVFWSILLVVRNAAIIWWISCLTCSLDIFNVQGTTVTLGDDFDIWVWDFFLACAFSEPERAFILRDTRPLGLQIFLPADVAATDGWLPVVVGREGFFVRC